MPVVAGRGLNILHVNFLFLAVTCQNLSQNLLSHNLLGQNLLSQNLPCQNLLGQNLLNYFYNDART